MVINAVRTKLHDRVFPAERMGVLMPAFWQTFLRQIPALPHCPRIPMKGKFCFGGFYSLVSGRRELVAACNSKGEAGGPSSVKASFKSACLFENLTASFHHGHVPGCSPSHGHGHGHGLGLGFGHGEDGTLVLSNSNQHACWKV